MVEYFQFIEVEMQGLKTRKFIEIWYAFILHMLSIFNKAKSSKCGPVKEIRN